MNLNQKVLDDILRVAKEYKDIILTKTGSDVSASNSPALFKANIRVKDLDAHFNNYVDLAKEMVDIFADGTQMQIVRKSGVDFIRFLKRLPEKITTNEEYTLTLFVVLVYIENNLQAYPISKIAGMLMRCTYRAFTVPEMLTATSNVMKGVV